MKRKRRERGKMKRKRRERGQMERVSYRSTRPFPALPRKSLPCISRHIGVRDQFRLGTGRGGGGLRSLARTFSPALARILLAFLPENDPHTGGGGGGYFHYAYWVCAARETPFLALNFRSGAYHFHKLPKNPFRSISILHFWRILSFRRPSFSKFL